MTRRDAVSSAETLLARFRWVLAQEAKEVLQDSTRDSVLFVRSRGLDGGAPEPLRKTAERHGISAERVRQVCENINNTVMLAISSKPVHASLRQLVAQALEAVAVAAPGTDEAVSARIQGTPLEGDGLLLLGGAESASSLVRLGQLLDLGGPVCLDRWAGQAAIVNAAMPRCFNQVITHARKLISASGAVSSGLLVQHLSHLKGLDLTPREVEAMLLPFATEIATEPAGEEGGRWFSFETAENDTLTRARNRIGSFGWCSLAHLCSFLPVGTLVVDTPSRSFTRSQHLVSLPECVMATMLSRRGLTVRGDRVTLAVLSSSYHLPPVQQQMVDLLRVQATKGPVRQTAFLEACVAAGMNRRTARAYLFRAGLFHCEEGFCRLAP